MKKVLIACMTTMTIIGLNQVFADEIPEAKPVVTIEIPANQVESIDVKYKNATPSTTTKVKESTNKTVNKTKEITDKTVQATKKAAATTKDATKKTYNTTKTFTERTIDNTKDVIDDLNPNKPVTLESIETKASIKTLKVQRDAQKAAYNSKIKDVNAQIKAAEYSTTITDVERQNKIYTLNKEKTALTEKRNNIILEYNDKIASIRKKK